MPKSQAPFEVPTPNTSQTPSNTQSSVVIEHKDVQREKVKVLKDASADPQLRARTEASLKRGEYDQAIADASEEIRFDPKNTFAYWNRAEAYRKKGELNNAKRDEARAKYITAGSLNAALKQTTITSAKKYRIKEGALSDFARGFLQYCLDLGYKPATVAKMASGAIASFPELQDDLQILTDAEAVYKVPVEN